jgi:hypothetical protein
MPDLEVTIDEVKSITEAIQRSQADQAKESARMAASYSKAEREWKKVDALTQKIDAIWKRPTAAEGSGGFLEQLIGKVSGKGGILSAGMAGGMAAGGIMALAQIIGDAISNSKILMTILSTIGQALWLLIDVILLPFLPILTTGIIWLYQGIMLFYKLWNGIWTSKTMQTIGSALTVLGGILAKGISSFFNVQFGLIGAGADLIWKVLTWLWGIITGGGIITASLAFILGPFGVLLDWLYDIATGKTTIKATVDFLLGSAGDLLNWLWNAVTTGIKINLDFINNATKAVTEGVSGAASAVGGAVSNTGGWLGGVMSGGWLKDMGIYEQGGVVPGTGPQLAVVHGGETITPAGQSGGITINMPNYVGSKSDMMKVVSDILRQQQYRYQA